MDLSIVIVNWNTQRLLRDCLASIIEKQWASSLEVIVVDNASSDGSVEMVNQNFAQVRVIANRENVGFARANNQGFKIASGRYVLLLNSDTVVLTESLDALVRFMDEHSDAGMVGSKVLNPDRSLQRSCWRGYPSLKMAVIDAFYLWRLLPDHPWVRLMEIPERELDRTLQVDHVLGASMMVRREIIEQIGGMAENIFLFLEETEWCFRFQKHGWKVYFYPGAEIIHFGQQSVHKNPERTLPEKYRNFMWFYRNFMNPSAIQKALLKVTFALAGVIRMGLWTWRGRRADEREQAARMRRGYWLVVKQAMFL